MATGAGGRVQRQGGHGEHGGREAVMGLRLRAMRIILAKLTKVCAGVEGPH